MIYVKEYDEFLNEMTEKHRTGIAILASLFLGTIGAISYGLYKIIKIINAPSIDQKIKDIINKHLSEEEQKDLINILDNDEKLTKYHKEYMDYFNNKYGSTLDIMQRGIVTKDTIINFINSVNNDVKLQKIKGNLKTETIRVISPKYIKQYETINKEISETVGEKYNYLEHDVLKIIFGPNYKKQFDIQ